MFLRNEVVRIDSEHSRAGCSGIADHLERSALLQSFEVLGKIIRCDEGYDVGAQDFSSVVMECFSGRFPDGAVHTLGLTVGSRMIRLGEPVFDAILIAYTIKRMLHHVVFGRSVLGEGYAVVRQHPADLIRESLHDATEKR